MKRPAKFKQMSNEIQDLRIIQRNMGITLRAIEKTHKDSAQIREQAYQDGVPGSNEPFNVAPFAMEVMADCLIRQAQRIKDLAASLRNTEVENW
jgi:hypothetical protein